MKTCQWIGLVCCLLFGSTGCNFLGHALYTTTSVLGDPDSLYFAKQRAGIGTFPVHYLQPPADAPQLRITYGEANEDGVVYFAHTNERLHYTQCVDRIQKVLDQNPGQVNLAIQTETPRDLFGWETQFDHALRGIKGGERLQVTWEQVKAKTTPLPTNPRDLTSAPTHPK